jgi:hypothetical protein
MAKDIPIGYSRVVLALETRGLEHTREVRNALREEGYEFRVLS